MLRFLALWSLVLLLAACAPQKVEPTKLPLTAIDEQKTAFPPEENELLQKPRLYVNLITHKHPTVTQAREEAILGFTADSLSRYAAFAPIEQRRVENLLSQSDYRGFRAESAAQAIELGKALGAQFVMQTELSIASSKLEKGVDRFKAIVGLTVFKVDSGQVVFKENLNYDSSEPAESRQEVKPVIQRAFPLMGFVLQTRGDRQVAKISLGSSLGLQVGRKVQIRKRKIERDLVQGLNTGVISYSEALATAEVIQVQANDAWVELDPRDRDKIHQGDVVYTLPEKRSSLF
ncbi:MAG: hypothetical protein RRB13_00315 [bacterium]|nr:hypothetical protein [bacterium]